VLDWYELIEGVAWLLQIFLSDVITLVGERFRGVWFKDAADAADAAILEWWIERSWLTWQ